MVSEFSGQGRVDRLSARMPRLIVAGLLLAFTLLAALGLQGWVGQYTVYDPRYEDKRAEVHTAIVHNRPPEGGTWEGIGARNTNTRVASVWLAEGIHQASGIKLSKVYLILDTAFLWATLVMLFVLLTRWVDPVYGVIGLLYFVSILPLSYFFYYFHPWDRLSQLFWVLLFLCVKTGRMGAFVVALAASMLVKFDTVLVPALYWLATVTRSSFWQVSLRTMALFAVSFSVLGILILLFPDGASTPRDASYVISQVAKNFQDIRTLGLLYPPLLAHLVPLMLALAGWHRADRVARAGVVFGVGCLIPIWLLQTNFIEVRAQLPLLILLLPAALLGLQRLVEAAAPMGDGRGRAA